MKKLILNRIFLLVIFLSFFGCKSYYDLNKVYFKDNEAISKNSELLKFKIPLKINFSGTLVNNSKSYKVSGIIKINDYNNFQILLSSRTLGIELARVEFFGDSLIFINKIYKTSFKSKINEVPFLQGLKLNSDKVIRIITGRSFDNINYFPVLNTELYKYNNYSYSGIIDFYNFGFLKSHNISIGSSKIIMNYGNYYKRYMIPYDIEGNLFTRNSNFKFNFKYYNIQILNTNYTHFVIPNNS